MFERSLSGETDDAPESAFLLNVNQGWRGVRTDRYSYARVSEAYMDEHAPPQGPEWLLFDHRDDPDELQNRVYDPEYADISDRLDRLVDEWLDETDDPF